MFKTSSSTSGHRYPLSISTINTSCILVFIMTFAFGAYLTHSAVLLYTSKQALIAAELVNAQASSIERRLSRSLSSTRILAQEIRQNNGDIPNFEQYAEEVLQAVGGVSNLQLAPKGVITQIHPIKGNEKALGHDILNDDRRRKEALLAVERELMTLAGPFPLIQGGIAVIGRNPVFLVSEQGKKTFWGFASALIFLEDLIAVSDLADLEKKGYSYTLSRLHPDTLKLDIFAQSETPLTDTAIAVDISIPNATWTLNLSLPPSNRDLWQLAGFIFSAILASLLSYLLRKILFHPLTLQRVVSEQTRELQHLARYDHLTGLPNRRLLNEHVQRTTQECQKFNFQAALLMIDLDDFKRINDLCGHNVGDEVLKTVSGRLLSCVRDSDLVSRLGGDEFGILIKYMDNNEDLNAVIQEIKHTLRQPIEVQDQAFTVAVSIGIALLPKDGPDFTSAYRHADMAMYEAKRNGKNDFHLYDHVLQTEAIEKLEIQSSLGQAITNNEFQLYLQPIVNLETTQTAGYEALIRWNHPQKGFLTPNVFIGPAEETHHIFNLGYWVFEEACRLIKQHDLKTWVSVNLSPKQFNDSQLVERLSGIIRKHKIDPTQLEIEVTESCLIDNIQLAIETMEQIKSLGMTIALDDFGTGYSSLSILKQLPVDILKIDRSFISELEVDTRDSNIVRGLNIMAHQLGHKVVAEGIETKEQLELLQSMGCDYGQGYLFSKPKPIEEHL